MLGHGSCGGVAAALTQRFHGMPPGRGGFIDHWVDMLDGARERVLAEHGDTPAAVRALEEETVRVSLANLRTFPIVAKKEKAGKLKLRGAYFAISDGVLHVMGADGTFNAA